MKVITNKFTIRALFTIVLLISSTMANRALGANMDEEAPAPYAEVRLEENMLRSRYGHASLCEAQFNEWLSGYTDASAPANWEAYGYLSAQDCNDRQFLPNFYEILGFHDTSASAKDINAAYRRAALNLHPDRARGRSRINQNIATEMFKRINNAKEILHDPYLKTRYDAQLARNGLTHWDFADAEIDNDNVIIGSGTDFLTRFIDTRKSHDAPKKGSSEDHSKDDID